MNQVAPQISRTLTQKERDAAALEQFENDVEEDLLKMHEQKETEKNESIIFNEQYRASSDSVNALDDRYLFDTGTLSGPAPIGTCFQLVVDKQSKVTLFDWPRQVRSRFFNSSNY